jgi:hypothetical protein
MAMVPVAFGTAEERRGAERRTLERLLECVKIGQPEVLTRG